MANTNIKFEGIDPQPFGSTELPDGYSGLQWDNFHALDTRPSQYANTGYRKGTVSPTSVAFNGSGLDASFSSPDTTFSLKKAYFTGAFGDVPVTVTAFLDGVEVGHKTFGTLNTLPTLVEFGHRFKHIDAVIVSTGSVISSQVAIDNLKVEFDVPGAPDPIGASDHALVDMQPLQAPAPELDLLGTSTLLDATDGWMFC